MPTGPHEEPREVPYEEPSAEADPADAAEQRTELTPQEDDSLTSIDPATANEADAAEQTRVVPLDEDDYRA
jgi:hypothetical protein